MKIQTSATGLTLLQLRVDLQRQFPGYHFMPFGRQLLVSKSILEGVGVVVNKGSVTVHALPASVTSMLVLAALGALFLVPGLIFWVVQITKSAPLTKEIGEYVALRYAK